MSLFRSFFAPFYTLLSHQHLKQIYFDYYINDPYKYPKEGHKVELRDFNARKFMLNQLDTLTSRDLGARLCLQLTECEVLEIPDNYQKGLTLVQTYDSGIPNELKCDIKKA